MSLAKSPPNPLTEGVRGCTTAGTLISSPGESLEGAGVLLLSLWHDAHEFATEDVPPPFKPDSVRDLQQMLDERMWLGLFDLQQLPADVQKWVKWLDAVLTSTEARMLMHPDVGRHFPKKSNAAEAAINLWRGIPSEWIADYFVDDTRKLLKEIKLGR
jgi:5'-deoxynucleotidase YfbR-like HD superfamily hydrolase